jgi:hypothetical protein
MADTALLYSGTYEEELPITSAVYFSGFWNFWRVAANILNSSHGQLTREGLLS